jgi:hypothetical protein
MDDKFAELKSERAARGWVLSAGTASCDVQHVCSMASACSASRSFAFPHHLAQIYSCGEPLSNYLA